MTDKQPSRPWKRLVPESHYRIIEGVLYSYADKIVTVADWKSSVLHTSRKPDDGLPRGHAHISDPTAMAAERLNNPPPRIAEAMAWINIVDEALRIMHDKDLREGSHIREVCRAIYHLESVTSRYGARNKGAIVIDLSMRYNVSERTIRAEKDLAVEHVWIVAVHKGMLPPYDGE